MSKCKISLAALFCIILTHSTAFGQHRWTNLNGPCLVSGIDVAYGTKDYDNNEAWHRYLLGTNGSEVKPFFWWPVDFKWNYRDPLVGANKVISYKDWNNNTIYSNGRVAYCSAYGHGIWKTEDGGVSWLPKSFPTNFNNHFTTIEVRNTSGGDIYAMAGCESYNNAATTFIYHHINGQDRWDRLGEDAQNDPDFYGVTINDLEDDGQGSVLVAATSNGIYTRKYFQNGNDNFQLKWGRPVVFSGDQVTAVATIDGHYTKQIASRIDQDQINHLCFSNYPTAEDAWSPNTINELLIDGDPFDKAVRDVEAAYFGNYEISCYAATNEGAYLLHFTPGTTADCQIIDLKQYFAAAGYSQLLFDQNVKAIDCYHENDFAASHILIATPFNIYEIVEERDGGTLTSLTITDATAGTYPSNVTGLTFPANTSGNEQVFTVSDNSFIKRGIDFSSINWNAIGAASDVGEVDRIGTDIAFKTLTATSCILASSKDDQGNGTIMRSDDDGQSWENVSPDAGGGSHLAINTLDFDPVYSNAYAAGADNNVWISTDVGESWTQVQGVSSTEFHDIYSNPSGQSAYLGGHGESGVDVRAYWYSGSQWGAIDDGLSSVTDVNQFAQNADDYFAYAATDIGVFKADVSSYPPTWEERNYGIETPQNPVNIGSIVSNKNDYCAFLASTASSASSPHIWASGDSGRSWNNLPLGDIPEESHINKLAASQDDNSGFVAGTDLGVYYLGPIFKSGELTEDETWGPGTVIVNGDVTVPENITLTVAPACTVKFVYNFDKLESGIDEYKSELIIQGTLVAEGDQNNTIVFESSHPDAPTANQWYGIRLESYSTASFDYCLIEHAYYGIFYSANAHLAVDHSHIEYCSAGGIY
ncbi:MAG TPA: hypothetical protein DEO84_06770, partial [candidate division Zixibacteria bacterium]|nr:hypothetical protein [candidate division Zixibacteria bacterium]